MKPKPLTKRQAIAYLVLFSFTTALMFIAVWMSLQVIVPRIAEASHVLDNYPELLGVVAICCGITYVFNNLLD